MLSLEQSYFSYLFHLVVRRASNCCYFFQKSMFSDLVMWGFFKYMRQILKTFMLTLLDETSLTAIRVPHPFSIQTLSLSLLDLFCTKESSHAKKQDTIMIEDLK